MSKTAPTVDNGVNVEALLGAREALSEAPEAAQFQWRATCEWLQGTHSRSTVEGFFGLGEELLHKSTFTFDQDHPEVFASEDNGAAPVELILAGLAGCLTAGIASVAQLRGETTILAVSHQPTLAAIADRVYHVDRGTIRIATPDLGASATATF